jgi:hypothetical protein
LLFDEFNSQYFDILDKYRESIIVEVAAHDHYTDLRYHENSDFFGKYQYHNMIVSPGVTPING